MSKQDILIGLAETYDKTLSPGAVRSYLNAWADISEDALQAAVDTYNKDPKSVFMPRPGQIIALVGAPDLRAQYAEALHDQTRAELRARLQALKDAWYTEGDYDLAAFIQLAEEAQAADLPHLAEDAREQARRIEETIKTEAQYVTV